MKTVVAGSRRGIEPDIVIVALDSCPWVITHVNIPAMIGVARAAEVWALNNRIRVSRYQPYVKASKEKAWKARNRNMVASSRAVLLIWDGHNRVMHDLKRQALAQGRRLHEVVL